MLAAGALTSSWLPSVPAALTTHSLAVVSRRGIRVGRPERFYQRSTGAEWSISVAQDAKGIGGCRVPVSGVAERWGLPVTSRYGHFKYSGQPFLASQELIQLV